MAIDFPSSPTTGQNYTFGNVTFQYDGEKWVLVGAGPTLPLSIANGGTGNNNGVTAPALYVGGAAPPSGVDAPINLGLAISAAASALTIALKGADGNDPSASNPVLIPFRNATEATGTPTFLSITAAASLVISSGSTLGVTTSQAFRLWVVGFNDAGTFRLGVINCSTWSSSACNIYPLSEWGVASSTAEGGAGAADNAGVFYTGTAVSAKAYRVLGFIEWSASGLTAGTWTTTNLLRSQLFSPSTRLPGDWVQVVSTTAAATAFVGTLATYVYATGNTVSITPSSAANIIRATVNATLETDAANRNTYTRMSRGTASATNMFGSETNIWSATTGGGDMSCGQTMLGYDKPNTASAQAYAVQLRVTTGGELTNLIACWELVEMMG